MRTHQDGVIGVCRTHGGTASSPGSRHASPLLWAAIGPASMIARPRATNATQAFNPAGLNRPELTLSISLVANLMQRITKQWEV
jgi:hypothetical protein